MVDKSELTELFRARDVFSEGQEYVEENYNDWSKLYTTLQLFEKNNAQGAFSCIINLHTKLYEREWPCTSGLLYNKNNLIGRLYRYFYNQNNTLFFYFQIIQHF